MDLSIKYYRIPLILACHHASAVQWTYTICFLLSFFVFFLFHLSTIPQSLIQFNPPGNSHLPSPPVLFTLSLFPPCLYSFLVLTLHLQFSRLSCASLCPPLSPLTVLRASPLIYPANFSLFPSLLSLPLAASSKLLLVIINLQSTKHNKQMHTFSSMRHAWHINTSNHAHTHEPELPDTHTHTQSFTATKPQRYAARPWEKRGSYHTTAQTGTQSPILYVGACLWYTNQCTQTNIPRCKKNTSKHTNKMGTQAQKQTYTNTVNQWINKKTQPLYTGAGTWEWHTSSSKEGLKEHTATPPQPLPPSPARPWLPIYVQRPSINLSLTQASLWSTVLSQGLWRAQQPPAPGREQGRQQTRDERKTETGKREWKGKGGDDNDKRCGLLTE